jgi:hypothetical protein
MSEFDNSDCDYTEDTDDTDDTDDEQDVIEYDEDNIIEHITNDINEINIIGNCDAHINKTLDDFTVMIVIDPVILEKTFNDEQLQAMSLLHEPINIVVKISYTDIKICKIFQNDKQNMIESIMIYMLNELIKLHQRTYKNHKTPYDFHVIDTLKEFGDISICIAALIKYKNHFDDACAYILEHSQNPKRLNVLDIISTHNNLAFIIKYFCDELSNICKHCVLCKRPLNYHCVKPTICNNGLCQVQYVNMGIGFSLESEIIDNPETTDLLISLFVVFLNNGKSKIDDRFDMSFFDSYGITIDQIKKCVELIPSIPDMCSMIKKQTFSKEMRSIDQFIIPLLRWIIASNLTYLKVCDIADVKRIDSKLSYNVKKSFIMKTTTLDKERIFNQKKDQYGIKYFYHGSACHNWHLILKNGLKNYSNTKYMTAGAAYGSGIYLANNILTSLGYCGCSGRWNKSMFNNLSIIALCEVANVPSLANKSYDIYTLTDEAALITRYLLIV